MSRRQNTMHPAGTGLAIGAAIGLIIGLMFDNIGLGLAAGAGLGLIIGALSIVGADPEPAATTARPGRAVHKQPARRLTAVVEAATPADTSALATQLLRAAYAQGLSGATVFHGAEGYRLPVDIESYRNTSPSGGAPTMVVLIGEPESIDDFAVGVAAALPDALITVEDVTEITGVDGGVTDGGTEPPADTDT